MARVQLALNVSDLDTAVEFYSQPSGPTSISGAPVANFEIADPPMKLVLFEVDDRGRARKCPQPHWHRSTHNRGCS